MVDAVVSTDEPQRTRLSFTRVSWWFLLAATGLVPLAIGFLPFLGSRAIFLSHTSLTAQSAALGVLLGLSALCWVVGLVRGEAVLRATPHAWWLTALATLMLGSTLFALDKGVAVFGHDSAEQGLLTYLGCLLALFLVTQLVDRRTRLLKLSYAIALSGGVVALLGILESLGLPFFPLDRAAWLAERGTSTLGNPDTLGTFLVVPLIISLSAGITHQSGWRWLWRLATVLIGVCIVFTQTRGAWLGVAVALVLFLVVAVRSRGASPRQFKIAAVSGLLLLGSAAGVAVYKMAVGAQPLLWRIVQTFNSADASGGRWLIWGETAKLIGRRPILGFGADNMLYAWYASANTDPVRSLGVDGVLNEPHSYWLTLGVSFGVAAVVIVVALVCLVLWDSKDAMTRRDALESEDRALRTALWSGAVGLSVALSFSIVLTPLALLFWVVLGLLMAPGVKPVRAHTYSEALRLTVLITTSLLGVSLFVWGGLTGLASATEYVSGGASTEAKLAAARAAAGITPWRPYPVLLEAQVLEQSGGSPEQVVQVVDRLIERAPREYTYYEIQVRLLRGEPERAIRVIERALEVRPAGMRIRAERARARALRGDVEGALREITKVWEVTRTAVIPDPRPDIGIIYVQVLAANGDYATAREVLSELAATFPDDAAIQELGTRLSELNE